MIEQRAKKFICLLDGCYFVSEIEQDAEEHYLEQGSNHKIALIEANGELICRMQQY